MAQHDYVIDNSTGANVRADLNNALQAIVTNNSGSSAPSATFPFMLFADSSAGTMKIRNAADNAFIELFQLDGTFTLEDGSASTPALAFRDDLSTGIFSSAAFTFNVATGGVERMELGTTTIFNEHGADVDFRIEGDTDPNLFYLDAGNDRIGIGTNSPQHLLDIDGKTKTTQLAIGGANTIVSGTEMQLNVTHARSNNSSYPFILDNATTTAANARGILIKWTGSSGNFSANTGGDYLRCTADGEGFINAVISGAGLGQFRGGVRFGTDSADANILHDYEEGDFTFHLRSEGGSNASMSGRVGRYVKIGQTVHIIGGGQYSGDPDNRSSTNAIEFTNLPFANVSTGLGSAGLPFPVMYSSLSSSGMSSMAGSQPYQFIGRLDNNATSGRIVAFNGAGDQDPQNASLACVNNTQLYVMFTYQTTA